MLRTYVCSIVHSYSQLTPTTRATKQSIRAPLKFRIGLNFCEMEKFAGFFIYIDKILSLIVNNVVYDYHFRLGAARVRSPISGKV